MSSIYSREEGNGEKMNRKRFDSKLQILLKTVKTEISIHYNVYPKRYHKVKRIQEAITPATIMSSLDRLRRILSTSVLMPGIFPTIFPIVDWTLPSDNPWFLKSDRTSFACATTALAEFKEL